MFQPGDRIDDLVVDALLGQGSAASIYRVRHAETGAWAALKIAHSTDPTICTRMLSEGRVLQQIDHSNVITVHRALMVGRRPALLMELIEGPTLAAWLDHFERPSIPDALELFKGIARGVQAAHYRGLIHRDLNPSNILLASTDGNQLLPVIVDFGLARPVERLHTGPTLQGPLGTISYMAPEQMDDGRSADRRSDLYALGCILYEICTGGRAFEGNLFTVHQKSQAGEYVDPADARPDMPFEVAEVIARLLQPDPDARYDSVQEMMEDLYEGPPPMMTDESDVSGVFQKWSLSEVSSEAAAAARTLAPRTEETDSVEQAHDRTVRRLRAERAALGAALGLALAVLALTIGLLLTWI